MGFCLSKKISEPGHKSMRHGVHNHKNHEPFVNQSKAPSHQTYQSPEKFSSAPQKPVHRLDTILGKPFEDVRKFYTLGTELGRGKFGVTYLCIEKSTGLQYACKSISKRSNVNKEDIKREIQIMQHLSGQPNIVDFKGAYEDKQSVHVIMELCSGGQLYDRIIAKGHYSERDAASICIEIVNAIHICHSMCVMHRDLKPENFLFSSKDDKALLKATDFGLSAFIEEDTTKEIFGAILKCHIDFESHPWPTISNSAKDLIRKMLTQDPKKRITSAQILGRAPLD